MATTAKADRRSPSPPQNGRPDSHNDGRSSDFRVHIEHAGPLRFLFGAGGLTRIEVKDSKTRLAKTVITFIKGVSSRVDSQRAKRRDKGKRREEGQGETGEQSKNGQNKQNGRPAKKASFSVLDEPGPPAQSRSSSMEVERGGVRPTKESSKGPSNDTTRKKHRRDGTAPAPQDTAPGPEVSGQGSRSVSGRRPAKDPAKLSSAPGASTEAGTTQRGTGKHAHFPAGSTGTHPTDPTTANGGRSHVSTPTADRRRDVSPGRPDNNTPGGRGVAEGAAAGLTPTSSMEAQVGGRSDEGHDSRHDAAHEAEGEHMRRRFRRKLRGAIPRRFGGQTETRSHVRETPGMPDSGAIPPWERFGFGIRRRPTVTVPAHPIYYNQGSYASAVPRPAPPQPVLPTYGQPNHWGGGPAQSTYGPRLY